ncbi:hypothetical protein BT93_J0277 [Corymbia citriodora subsp. variegata]|nr:hypothetical protein BT93_J0277 [Corymbia citriodora subsp. variegata]
MEDGSGSSHALPGRQESELQKLQRQHEEKMARIQELKREIEALKLRLEQRKSQVPHEMVEAFKALSDKHEKLREEYNALVADRKGREKLN